jgi:ABC-type uncharacterized transport system permease subunit
VSDFIAGVGITCFAASYAVALALEISRLVFRSGVRRALMLGFAAAGLFAHVLYLGHRAAASDTLPLATAFDWYLLAAWVLAAVYLYLTYYHPDVPVGLFILPLVLGLIAAAYFFADDNPFTVDHASLWWGAAHGVLLLLGTIAVMIGFVSGVMYLLQASRLKHKRPAPSRLRLPSLEWCEHVNSRAIVVSVIMLSAGLLSGLVLNMLHPRQQIPWTDPVVISSTVTLVWLIAAGMFNALYRPARQGRKVAYLTVASFLFLLFSLTVTLLVETQHGVSSTSLGSATEPSVAAVRICYLRATPSPSQSSPSQPPPLQSMVALPGGSA